MFQLQDLVTLTKTFGEFIFLRWGGFSKSWCTTVFSLFALQVCCTWYHRKKFNIPMLGSSVFLLAYFWFIFVISRWHTNVGKVLYIPTLAKQNKYTNIGKEGFNIGETRWYANIGKEEANIGKKNNMLILV